MPTRRKSAPQIYSDDLAAIHIKGYGFHWRGAAPTVLKWLRTSGIQSGTVLDLGCGGGQWLALLAQNGYKPVGIDASAAMIQAARKIAPSATLTHGSFDELDLPRCDAATALGEPLNYLRDVRCFQRALKNVYRALRPGGLFIFDVRLPATAPIETRTAARVGDNWACIALIDEDRTTRRLVRRITTFRRHGANYRRASEVHRLRLYSKANVQNYLEQLGFRVRTRRGYGDYCLGLNQAVFIARKPS